MNKTIPRIHLWGIKKGQTFTEQPKEEDRGKNLLAFYICDWERESSKELEKFKIQKISRNEKVSKTTKREK